MTALVLLVVVGVGSWSLAVSRADDTSSAASSADEIRMGVPTIVSAEALEEFAATHYPLYWRGEVPDTEIELTLTANSGTFVRYLPEGSAAGDPSKHLTVATYHALTGYEGLEGADTDLATVEHTRSGAVVAVFDNRPLSTYFSFENAAFQVEVYSPEKNESKKLTDDGAITLVGGETS
ncbi:hypothetical protein ACIG47_19110 [Promicromonospora sp. NPDC052451]|uniref:hypothetical protein n=1 Tax=Promicromonospora sp. NPDC052451 TaxID=3364407 RepID=UPI0037C6F537